MTKKINNNNEIGNRFALKCHLYHVHVELFEKKEKKKANASQKGKFIAIRLWVTKWQIERLVCAIFMWCFIDSRHFLFVLNISLLFACVSLNAPWNVWVAFAITKSQLFFLKWKCFSTSFSSNICLIFLLHPLHFCLSLWFLIALFLYPSRRPNIRVDNGKNFGQEYNKSIKKPDCPKAHWATHDSNKCIS